MKISRKKAESADPLDRDLSDLLATGNWKSVRFELEPKNKTVTIRMSDKLLKAIKEQAKKSGLDYQKFIRLTLERLALETS